jgi:hypothetical protein
MGPHMKRDSGLGVGMGRGARTIKVTKTVGLGIGGSNVSRQSRAKT